MPEKLQLFFGMLLLVITALILPTQAQRILPRQVTKTSAEGNVYCVKDNRLLALEGLRVELTCTFTDTTDIYNISTVTTTQGSFFFAGNIPNKITNPNLKSCVVRSIPFPCCLQNANRPFPSLGPAPCTSTQKELTNFDGSKNVIEGTYFGIFFCTSFTCANPPSPSPTTALPAPPAITPITPSPKVPLPLPPPASPTPSGTQPTLGACTAPPPPPPLLQGPPPIIPTSQYDNQRTSFNPREYILNAQNVNANCFGRVRSLPVDAPISAQLLYLPNVAFPNAITRNVLFAATFGNSIYAFNADTGGLVWRKQYLSPTTISLLSLSRASRQARTPAGISCNRVNYRGITGTPVIDVKTQRIFFVTSALENGQVTFRLRGLDIATGVDMPGSPTPPLSYAKAGEDPFVPANHLQRAALTLTKNGQILVPFGSRCFVNTWRGYIFTFSSQSLAAGPVFVTTKEANARGGIDMSGAGIAEDSSGNLYVATGLGDPYSVGDTTFTNTILKLRLSSKGWRVIDFYVPTRQVLLNQAARPQGSGGPVLLSEGGKTNVLVQAGLSGVIYVLNTASLGKYRPIGDPKCNAFQIEGCDVNALQAFRFNVSTRSSSAAAYWGRPGARSWLYVHHQTAPLTKFDVDPISKRLTAGQSAGAPWDGLFPGATPVVSTNSATSTSGVVWELVRADQGFKAALVAYDANTLRKLYDSTFFPPDAVGAYIDHTGPTIANGQVFVPTGSGRIGVYGLRRR